MVEIVPNWLINLLFDETIWSKESTSLKEKWAPISQKLKESDAFVFITPEWGGMASPALHNFFLFCSGQELSHKPALLASVSTGIGGSYPISEIRASGYKNTRVCYLPEQLIFRKVEDFLKEEKDESNLNLHNRVKMTLELLVNYSKAFQSIRKRLSFDFEKYPNGM